jgi:hypothetical protein
VQQNKFALAEVALPFWNRPDNFWIWSTLLLYTGKSNIWALEEALIQLWQPRLNTPFFIDSSTAKKASSTALRFRLQGSLVLSLPVAQTTLDLHAKTHSTSSAQLCISQPGRSLGNHSGFEFKLHSPIPNGEEDPLQRHWHSGLLLSTPPCHKNLGEPQRSYALNAIDRAVKFWKFNKFVVQYLFVRRGF